MVRIPVTVLFLLSFSAVIAQDSLQKKYSLFHPTPREMLRDMETDRPDVTESAITVDAGLFQYETDLASYERHHLESGVEHTFYLARGNFKIGLAPATSIQIGVETFVSQKHTDNGSSESNTGIGDVNLRVKQNIIGNDRGEFALAVLPYVKFPTAGYTKDSRYEGGLIVPMQLKLKGDWKLGAQLEIDRLKDEEGEQMHTEFLQSLTLSHEIIKNLTGIAESYYTYDFNNHHLSNFLNAAIQIEIFQDFKLDAGINYGIQKDARKKYFLGLAFRI